jgi:hypothetical protein
MSEETKQNPESVVETQEEGQTGKVLTQEQIDDIVKKRVSEVKERAEKEKAEAVAEAERLATLSAEQKEKELRERQSRELEERERSLQLKENKIIAREELQKRGIDPLLSELVEDVDQERMLSRISDFEKSWKRSVEQAVADQLKGTPPKDLDDSRNERPTPGIVRSF